MNPNQNPEQVARDKVDLMLEKAGWRIQDYNKINFQGGLGVAVKEYITNQGRPDYSLFVDGDLVGLIEVKKEDKGQYLLEAAQQNQKYSVAEFKNIRDDKPVFLYETNGEIINFTNELDPRPLTRDIFYFHNPKTLQKWSKGNLLQNIKKLPALNTKNLRKCQINAIEGLEALLKKTKNRALIQMATGSGKTYTAITSSYRLLKHAKAGKILFLVDTRNLAEQAEQEFTAYTPNDENRKFSEIYKIQRLQNNFLADDAQIYICTIQRMASMLKGDKELDSSLEETLEHIGKKPFKVGYNPKIPVEFFDCIFIDECHRSIYSSWRQVIEYFHATYIGLTATPDNRAFSFFEKNIASEYTYKDAVVDGVNVDNIIYIIDTEISKKGEKIKADQYVEEREVKTGKSLWEWKDEETEYSAQELDRKVVNKDQIRTIISTFNSEREKIFPNRKNIPKTLIFSKNESHANDIVEIVRKEFGENKVCEKITYSVKNASKVLANFRNGFYPRIAVTVNMIATGTDVKALECLLFMRDVKSRNYFEQMKGRGTRTLSCDDLKKVTPDALSAKTHFVIVDAVGVTKSLKTPTRNFITKPHISLEELANSVMFGNADDDIISSLVGRLSRLNQQLSIEEKEKISEKIEGKELSEITRQLLGSIDPDNIEQQARQTENIPKDQEPTEAQLKKAKKSLIKKASHLLNGDFINTIVNINRSKNQIMDNENPDKVIHAGWSENQKQNNANLVQNFKNYLQENKEQIEVLQIFYSQPARRSKVTFKMIAGLLQTLKDERPALAPIRVWEAYAELDKVKKKSPQKELTALVSLVRRVCELDSKIDNYAEVVDRNFKNWIFQKHSGNKPKFSEEQMEWLQMIKEHIKNSFHITRDDFENTPFNNKGGLGKIYQLLGAEQLDDLLEEINRELAV